MNTHPKPIGLLWRVSGAAVGSYACAGPGIEDRHSQRRMVGHPSR